MAKDGLSIQCALIISTEQQAVSISSICQTQQGVNAGASKETDVRHFQTSSSFDAECPCNEKDKRRGIRNKALCFVFLDKEDDGYLQATSVYAPQSTSANFDLSIFGSQNEHGNWGNKLQLALHVTFFMSLRQRGFPC